MYVDMYSIWMTRLNISYYSIFLSCAIILWDFWFFFYFLRDIWITAKIFFHVSLYLSSFVIIFEKFRFLKGTNNKQIKYLFKIWKEWNYVLHGGLILLNNGSSIIIQFNSSHLFFFFICVLRAHITSFCVNFLK